MKKPELLWSKDYEKFVSNGFNRDLHSDSLLRESMETHGFMPSKPIQVKRIEGGRFLIICGHHRFDIARELGIPVCYVIDESNTDIFALEGSSKQRWTLDDFVKARAKAGDKECIALLEFKSKYNLPLGTAVSLFGGECAGSGNKSKALKAGKFKIKNIDHAESVASVIEAVFSAGVHWARSSQFIKAISLTLCVPEFDSGRFCRAARRHPSFLHRRALAHEYLDEIEQIYNYHSSDRMSVKFRALEESRKRQENFGSHHKR